MTAGLEQDTQRMHDNRHVSWSGFFRQYSPGIRIGLMIGAVFYLLCFVIAFVLERWWFNALLCVVGGVVGWFVGILGSPTSHTQSEKFAEYRRALSAFVSGFLLARIDVVLHNIDFARILDPYLLAGRVLLFVATFFTALQFTLVPRLSDIQEDQLSNAGES